MKIQVKDKSQNGVVYVRHISWQKRCEEQLNQILSEMINIKSKLKEAKSALEGVLYEQN